MSAAQYFILGADRATTGPFTLDQLRHMWRLGQITKQMQFAEAGYDEWLPLSALTELFEPSAPLPAPASRTVPPAAKDVRLEDRIAAGILKAVAILALVSLIVGAVFWVIRTAGDMKRTNDRAEQLLRSSY